MLSEMSSWADDLNTYVKQKSHAVVPVVSLHRYSRGAGGPPNTREYNILTNEQHKDDASTAYVRSQQAKAEEQVKRAIAKEMRTANHGYNIVNMSPKYGMSEEAVELIGKGCGEHHKGKMILPTPGATNAHPFATEFVGDAPHEELPRQTRKPRNQRPTNIVSHRYIHDHEKRTAEETENLRHRLEVKALVDAPFNPLTGRFRSLDAELAAQNATADKEARQRMLVDSQLFKVSKVVGRSEGHSYNILASDVVYCEGKLVEAEAQKVRGVPQRAMLRQAWEHQRDADEALRETDARRALARTRDERVKELMRRGHDAITNQPFGLSRGEEAAGAVSAVAGADTARPPMPMSSLKQPSVMDVLAKSLTATSMHSTEVLRAVGPRSTHERVFHNATAAPAAGSISSAPYTYDGRRTLLLPSLAKSTTEKSLRQFS